MKSDDDTKNVPVYAIFDVDSKLAIQNTIAPRNFERVFENMYSFLPPGGSCLSRWEWRHEQSDFKNEI